MGKSEKQPCYRKGMRLVRSAFGAKRVASRVGRSARSARAKHVRVSRSERPRVARRQVTVGGDGGWWIPPAVDQCVSLGTTGPL